MAEPAAAAGTAVEKINVKNVTGTLFNYSNATAYQCGAQFTENEFHVVNNSAVPRSLVRHNAFDAQTDLVRFFEVFTLCYIYIGLAIASIILVATLLDQRRAKVEAKSKDPSEND